MLCVKTEVFLLLRKIELFGFKSFADRTVLNFEKGITAVVGPNGCGKSNIIDAFRWVMGEQSAKSMRGDKMFDVIFSGASKRKAANYAEVGLTFSDVGETLQVDYDEVRVSRRVYRSGDSEYRINRNPVRLKDLQNLFLGTGVGKGAFSIFEQGKIDQIILNNSVQRRYIFEEVAGISRFKQSKKAVLAKLEHTQANLERVVDLHGEVKRQMDVLAKQAEIAKKYKGNKGKLIVLEKAVLFARWGSLEDKKKVLFFQEKALKQERGKNDKLLQEFEEECLKCKEMLAVVEEGYLKAKEGVFKAINIQEVAGVKEASHGESKREVEKKRVRVEKELQELNGSCKGNELQLGKLRKEHEIFQKKLQREDSLFTACEKKVLHAEEEVVVLRKDQKDLQDLLVCSMEKVNHWDSRLKDEKARLEGSQEKIITLKDQKKELTVFLKKTKLEIVSRKETVDANLLRIKEQKKSMEKFEGKISDVNEKIRFCGDELKAFLSKTEEVKARKKVLEQLQEEMEGLSFDTQELLKESRKKKSVLSGLLQPLYERISTLPGYEEVLGTVFRFYSQTILVKTTKDREKVLAFAKERNLKDFSLFCLEELNIGQKNAKKPCGKFRPLMSCMEESPLVEHFLSNIYYTEDIEQAIVMKKRAKDQEILIGKEIFIDRFSVLSSSSQGERNIFVREAEIKMLSKELKKLEKAVKRLEEKGEVYQREKTSLLEGQTELDQKIRREEMKLVEVNFFLQNAIADHSKAEKDYKRVEAEDTNLRKEIENFTVLVKEAGKQTLKEEKELKKHRSSVAVKEKELEKKESCLEGMREECRKQNKVLKEILEKERTLANSLSIYELQVNEWGQRKGRLEKELMSLVQFKEELLEKEKDFQEKRRVIEKDLHKAENTCELLKKEVKDKKEHLDQQVDKLSHSRGESKLLEERAADLSVKIAKIVAGQESLELVLHDRYQLSMKDLQKQNFCLEGTLEDAEKQVQRLASQIERAGDVNMASIEEYEQYQTRHEFLNKQLEDIESSKEELLKIISKLDKESRKALKETFHSIRLKFKKNFEILFGGGEADLQLTESQDILEAGIEIIAQPPGKQMLSILLLSGGEKCMTAMALLFAIFEVKPAPFCLLDEIDAPLDDSNIARFVDVVGQFIDETQFVIVTHNKRTMAIADVLFGVSMEEKGVSKLLSLEFSNKEKTEGKKVLSAVH